MNVDSPAPVVYLGNARRRKVAIQATNQAFWNLADLKRSCVAALRAGCSAEYAPVTWRECLSCKSSRR